MRKLKDLSVIVENLFQRGVLSDEEVSKIQTERDDYDKTRNILDSVIKKGEKACYEFLRIIDMTRKRTLGRPPGLITKKNEGSTESRTFDLHHWISCFSFKEDFQESDGDYLQGNRHNSCLMCTLYIVHLREVRMFYSTFDLSLLLFYFRTQSMPQISGKVEEKGRKNIQRFLVKQQKSV